MSFKTIVQILFLFYISLAFCQEGEKLRTVPLKPLDSALESSYWVGLELDNPSQINKIGWLQEGGTDYLFGIFEGANMNNFIDALPLYMIK